MTCHSCGINTQRRATVPRGFGEDRFREGNIPNDFDHHGQDTLEMFDEDGNR